MRVKVDLVCMRVENYLFLVRAWKLTWFLRWSKLTWSQCAGSNLTSSQCRDEIILVVWVVEIDWLLVCWQKITTAFRMSIEIGLFWCVWSKLT